MTVIKTKNKEIVEKIQAKLTLQIGRRFTQQDTVDLCLEFAQDNLEEIICRASNKPRLTPKLAVKILKKIDQLPEIAYDKALTFAREEDKEIYSL